MMNAKIEEVLNTHSNAEFYSAYFYLAMAAYFERMNLKGFANWMRVQYQEEQAHALHMIGFITDRGGKVKLLKVDEPKNDWKDAIEVFEDTLAHEIMVSSLINNLVDVALKEKDHATVNFLQWYVNEQVEEEANVSDILQQLKIIEGKGPGLFILDRELKTRVFVDPFATAAAV